MTFQLPFTLYKKIYHTTLYKTMNSKSRPPPLNFGPAPNPKRIKLAPLRPDGDISFQLGPYTIDENSHHDSKNSKTWTEALAHTRTDIRTFDDSQISPEQLSVRSSLLSSVRNTLVTGEAGTGKTFTQLSLIKCLKTSGQNVFRIGPTHASVANLVDDSSTYQTFFAMPPTIDYLNHHDRKKHIKDMVSAVGRQNFIQIARHRIHEKSTLIIEEAAMISSEIIDLILDAIEMAAPGRIRVFLFFDILQLVPVTGKLLIESLKVQSMPTLLLLKNMRQSDDDDFLDLLRSIAKGQMDEVHYLMLKSRVCSKRQIHSDLQSRLPLPTRRLCARNQTVDEHNLRHLEELSQSSISPIYTSRAFDIAIKRMPDYSLAKLPSTVSMTIGAKIVFESSSLHEIGLYNGITGKIVDFFSTDTDILIPLIYIDKYDLSLLVHPVTEEIHSVVSGATAPVVMATRTQFPFSIAEATTIHKVQGQTLYVPAEIDLLHMNSPGQVYTALSRLTKFEHVTLKNLPPMKYGGGIDPVRPSRAAIAWCKRVGLFR